MYRVKRGRIPAESGSAWIGELYRLAREETLSSDGAQRFTCPGSSSKAPSSEDGLRAWFSSRDSDDTGYAARDMEHHSFRRLRSSEALVACDNEHGMNHPDVTNVLFGDGSVHAISLAELKEEGIAPVSSTTLEVGPDSPVESLRVLVKD